MDCKTAQFLLEFSRPGRVELGAAEAADVEAHLAACPDCGALARAERAFDARVGEAMLAVRVPHGLKGRILDRLAADRGAWYRRRIWQGVGAAAAVLLAVFLGVNWERQRVQPLDPYRIAQAEANQPHSDPRGEEVFAWLRQQGIEANPSVVFDYSLVMAQGLTEFQGKTVPMLLFVRFEQGGAVHWARMYVVRSGQFDLKHLPDESGVASSGNLQVQILRDLDRPHRVAYVVVYNSDSLRPFLPENSPVARLAMR